MSTQVLPIQASINSELDENISRKDFAKEMVKTLRATLLRLSSNEMTEVQYRDKKMAYSAADRAMIEEQLARWEYVAYPPKTKVIRTRFM